jgi:superfamily II DNA/RNA helicase
MPPVIKKLADKFLSDPKQVEVARPATANVNIRQWVVPVSAPKKRDVLRELLRREDVTNAIIFCNRKTTVRDLNKSLQKSGFRSSEIHGDMEQPQRIAELERFKKGDVNILVASDVAARGLDIKGVSHVFNFDAPWHPDDYIHRIGRTGRAGATGTAYTLVTPEDAENVREIEKLTGLKIERLTDGPAPAGDVEPAPERAPRRGRGGKREPEARREPKPRPEAEPKPEREAEPERAAEPPSEPEAPRPAERAPREAEPRRERGGRRNESRGDAPRPRQREADEGPDDGWNGPMPDFLRFTLGE